MWIVDLAKFSLDSCPGAWGPSRTLIGVCLFGDQMWIVGSVKSPLGSVADRLESGVIGLRWRGHRMWIVDSANSVFGICACPVLCAVAFVCLEMRCGS